MQAVFLDFATFGPADLDCSPLTGLLPGIRLHDDSPQMTLAGRLRDAEVVIVNKVVLDARILALAPQLKLICCAATGTDNVALDVARTRGIAVTNIRDYCAPSVTQHVFALMLALTQRLREYDRLLAGGAWAASRSFCLLDYPFHELRGRTLGVVGLGALGRSVAQVAQAFGMEVIAAQRPYAASAGGGQTHGIRRVAFTELLSSSHVVSLHCPLTAETRRLIDADALARMRRDALLINTARGALVDPAALLCALHDGAIAGAGIDVLEQEPPASDEALVAARLPNLIVTPHIAWAAREARERALAEIAANIEAYLSGTRRNRVD